MKLVDTERGREKEVREGETTVVLREGESEEDRQTECKTRLGASE